MQKYFSHPSFSYLLICNPTHKTETWTANKWGTTSSKPPGPIIMMGRSETLIDSQVLFITLSSAAAQGCCAFRQTRQNVPHDEPKECS
jgi:hypothetical protein